MSPVMAHQLERPVGNHLVGVHVGRGAGAALEHVEPKLVVELAVDELLTRAFDALQDVAAEDPAINVRTGRGQLDHRESADDVWIKAELHSGNPEVVEGTRRLHAVVRVRGHRLVAQQVVFDPCPALRHD
jgi:hypothetical protein